MLSSLEESPTATEPSPPQHQHVWEVVAVDGNDGPARNLQMCACGEVLPD